MDTRIHLDSDASRDEDASTWPGMRDSGRWENIVRLERPGWSTIAWWTLAPLGDISDDACSNEASMFNLWCPASLGGTAVLMCGQCHREKALLPTSSLEGVVQVLHRVCS